MVKYYVDTCIWMDTYEDRKGFMDEPLGEFAMKFFSHIRASGSALLITDHLILELQNNYSAEQIKGMFAPFEDLIEKIFVLKSQREEARKIALRRSVPEGDRFTLL